MELVREDFLEEVEVSVWGPRGSDSASWSLGDGGPEASFQGRAASCP